MNTQWFFFPALLILGVLTSYTDLRFHVIKNRHIILFFIYAAAINAMLCLTRTLPITPQFLCINIVFGIGISLLMYFNNIWGGGDAKLFVVYALLVPTNIYAHQLFASSLALFVNMIILGFIFVACLEILSFFKDPRLVSKRLFSLANVFVFLNSAVIIFTLTWAIRYLFTGMDPRYKVLVVFFQYLAYFFFYAILKKIRDSRIVLLSLLVLGLIVRAIVQPGIFHPISNLFVYLGTTLRYTLLFFVIGLIFINTQKKDTEPRAQNIPRLESERIPFAPIMFLGALFINSDLISWVSHFLLRGGRPS